MCDYCSEGFRYPPISDQSVKQIGAFTATMAFPQAVEDACWGRLAERGAVLIRVDLSMPLESKGLMALSSFHRVVIECAPGAAVLVSNTNERMSQAFDLVAALIGIRPKETSVSERLYQTTETHRKLRDLLDQVVLLQWDHDVSIGKNYDRRLGAILWDARALNSAPGSFEYEHHREFFVPGCESWIDWSRSKWSRDAFHAEWTRIIGEAS